MKSYSNKQWGQDLRPDPVQTSKVDHIHISQLTLEAAHWTVPCQNLKDSVLHFEFWPVGFSSFTYSLSHLPHKCQRSKVRLLSPAPFTLGFLCMHVFISQPFTKYFMFFFLGVCRILTTAITNRVCRLSTWAWVPTLALPLTKLRGKSLSFSGPPFIHSFIHLFFLGSRKSVGNKRGKNTTAPPKAYILVKTDNSQNNYTIH